MLSGREGQEGASPSGAFAEITIDSASMDGEDNRTERAVVSPGRVLGGVRSASPAKRSATDMEGGGDKSSSPTGAVPGSFAKDDADGPTHFDEAVASMPNGADAMDTQESVAESMDTSVPGATATNSSATSFQSEGQPPPYSAEDTGTTLRADTNYTTQEIDLQQARVMHKVQKYVDEGTKGVVVSGKWLSRVLSRSSEGLKNNEYLKESREGPIGPVDNSDIVPEAAFEDPILIDQQNSKFIPLKPGQIMSTDFEIMNDDAWGEIVGAYGIAPGQQVISRYARNTTDSESASNIQYEVYPPVFTIRKVVQPGQTDDGEEKRPSSASSAVTALRFKDEMRGRGQLSPDDAIRLVSSRQEKFQKFLARSKEAAGIQRSTKVKVWKLLDPSQSGLEASMSMNASASTPALATSAPTTKLVLSTEEFDKLEIGKDIEPIDARDLTNDNNYNGSSNMDFYVLGESHALILEEQIGGPGGGEFASNKKKPGPLFKLAKKDGGSKPGSAPASGRTSPAPQGGMMTRGRARRDGRTRGVVGLTNLGNTCYMNSALQCIRSVEELAIYFLSEKYKQEINMNNPLGHKGVMAKQYANILTQIYGDSAGTVTPSLFKKTIGNMQPMFSGYGQQDSQEFLSFLVDALHEDLNRILKKPYNENPDSDDSTVHDPQAIIDLGEVYRKNHGARNESIATDLFSGFYKNTMECPECKKISITFDPYSLLTVQLPIENTFQHNITFVPLRSMPVNHIIDMDKNSTIKTMKQYIASKHPGVEANRLWMVEVYSHKIYKVFDDAQTLAEASIQGNDYIFMFELDRAPSNPPAPEKKTYSYSVFSKKDEEAPPMDDSKADQFAVPVFPRQKNRYGNGFDVLLHPMYITVTREEAQDYDTILKKVLIAMSRLTSTPILTQEADKNDEVSRVDKMDRDDQGANGNAQVTDTSSSEDGYVNVSLQKYEQIGEAESEANGIDEDDRAVPAEFMDPQYFVSPTLRNQLFDMNYAKGDGIHCASMSSFNDKVHNMFDRVKQPIRRGSTDSSSSEEGSTTSTGDDAQLNGDAEESDDGDLNKPDIILGDGEASMGSPTPVEEDEEGNAWTQEDAFASRKGRRRNRKNGKRRGGKQKTYGKNKKNQHQGGGFIDSGQRLLGWKAEEDAEDNPYYIKLGEAIVLDWFPESFESLFGGSGTDPNEMRGHFVSHSDGKGLPIFDDPAVKEKKERRETRKKNGITLDDCFVETGKREVLSEDNAWYCNRCKELRRATKTLEIWTIPDILVVHLKRFGGTRSFRDKIDVLVDYPIEGLDMTERIGLKEDGKEYLYDLFAVDNHYGGLGGGHYTAMAKNFYDGQWYDYNGKPLHTNSTQVELI